MAVSPFPSTTFPTPPRGRLRGRYRVKLNGATKRPRYPYILSEMKKTGRAEHRIKKLNVHNAQPYQIYVNRC